VQTSADYFHSTETLDRATPIIIGVER